MIVEAAKDFEAYRHRREDKLRERAPTKRKDDCAKLEMRAASKRPRASHNREDPDREVLEPLDDEAGEHESDIEVIGELCEDIADPTLFFADVATCFAEDDTGRSSGLLSVAAPVPKKHRSKAKGKALECIPAAPAEDAKQDSDDAESQGSGKDEENLEEDE